MTLTPFLATITTASKMAAGLHFGDLGIGDAETAAAMAQHGIELVLQFFHAMQQAGGRGAFFKFADRDAVFLPTFPSLALESA